MNTENLISGYAAYTTPDEIAASATVEPPASVGTAISVSVASAAVGASVYNSVDTTFDVNC